MYKIEVGDLIEARVYYEDPNRIKMERFYVTAISGTAYSGDDVTCDTADGWELNMQLKKPENLALPTVLSEIVVHDRGNNAIQVVGKGETWRDQSGQPVSPSDIFWWEPTPE